MNDSANRTTRTIAQITVLLIIAQCTRARSTVPSAPAVAACEARSSLDRKSSQIDESELRHNRRSKSPVLPETVVDLLDVEHLPDLSRRSASVLNETSCSLLCERSASL